MPFYFPAASAARVPVPGMVGIQALINRMNLQITTASNPSGAAFEFTMELPARNARAVGGLGMIASQSASSTSPGTVSVTADVKFGAALTDLDGAWTGSGIKTQTFASQQDTGARIDFPAALAGTAPFQVQRRAYLLGDRVEAVPPARSDGGTLPLAMARITMGAANAAFIGDAGDDYSTWATRSGGLLRFRQNSGTDRTATTGWSTINGGLIGGFTYDHTGPILNVFTFGDSQSASRAPDFLGLNWVQRACEAINAAGPKTILSHSNLAWTGQGSDAFVQNFIDALDAGLIPDIAVIQVGTVNDTAGNVALTSAVVDVWRARFSRMLALCSQYRVCPLVWTLPPANFVARNYGASDSLRIAYNAEILALCQASGIVCLDAAAVVSGGVDGNGQQTIVSGYNLDNIHLNAAGQNALAAAAASPLQQLLAGYL